MPENNGKPDPFKPQQPTIPGVTGAAPTAKPVEEPGESLRARLMAKIPAGQLPPKLTMATLAGALVLGGVIAWLSHSSSAKVTRPAREVAAAPAPVEKPKPPEKLPVAPGEVATTDELAQLWSSKRFIFQDPATSRQTLGIVVHLPDGTFWGLSLREPYGSCEMEFVTDLEKLATEYHYRASHPMVGDPCNRTVFDLTRYGSAPGGLVRGEIAQGASIRPPMAIEIRIRGKQITAVRME
jgi:hypothetical protein